MTDNQYSSLETAGRPFLYLLIQWKEITKWFKDFAFS